MDDEAPADPFTAVLEALQQQHQAQQEANAALQATFDSTVAGLREEMVSLNDRLQGALNQDPQNLVGIGGSDDQANEVQVDAATNNVAEPPSQQQVPGQPGAGQNLGPAANVGGVLGAGGSGSQTTVAVTPASTKALGGVKLAFNETFETGDPKPFLMKVKAYFRAMKADPSCWVDVVGSMLAPSALQWYAAWEHTWARDQEGHPITPCWADFEEAMIAQYLRPDDTYLNRMEYERLYQSGSATDYVAASREKLVHVHSMDMDTQVAYFLQGLKPEVRSAVMRHRPEGDFTIEQAFRSAVRFDQQLALEKQYYRRVGGGGGGQRAPSAPSGGNSTSSGGGGAFGRGAGWANGNPSSRGAPTSSRGRYGGGRFVPRPFAGICFKCQQPGHKADACPNGKKVDDAVSAALAKLATELAEAAQQAPQHPQPSGPGNEEWAADHHSLP